MPRPASTSSKLPIILVCFIAVLVLAGGGLAIFHLMTGEQPAKPLAAVEPHTAPAESAAPAAPAQKTLDLSWLLPQADCILHIRPIDLLKSEFAQWAIDAADARKQFEESQESLRKEIGVSLADVESITLAFKINNEMSAGAANVALEGMPNPMQAVGDLSKLRDQEFSALVRLTKPIDLASITKLNEEADLVSYNDAKYYREKSQDAKPGEQCLYMPAPNVVVICGRENLLRSLIDAKGKSEPRAELDFIDPEQHISFALVPHVAWPAGPRANDPGGDELLAKFKNVQGASLGIKADDGLMLTISQLCPDSKIAEEVTTATDEVVTKLKGLLTAVREILPKNVGELADTLLTEMKISRHDRLVATVATLPATSRDNLKAAPLEVWQIYLRGMGIGVDGPGPTTSDPELSRANDGTGAPGSVKQLAGLPEGMTLEGSARWVEAESSDKGDPLPPNLEIEIKCLGGPADTAIQAGNLRLTNLATEPEQNFKVAERSAGDANQYRGLKDLERRRFDDLPAKYGAGVRIHLEHPAEPVSKFTHFEGDVTLRCVMETKDIIIPNVLEQGGKPTNDPHLKAVGFTIAVTKGDESTLLRVHSASITEIAGVKLVDSKGDPLPNSPLLVNVGAGKELDLASSFDAEKLPRGTALKVKFRTRIDEVKVPFRFENLAIPVPPAETNASTAGWRHSVAPDAIPEGLNVFGRLQWIERTDFDDDNKLQKTKAVALCVDVTGPQALKIIAPGFQNVDKAETTPGLELEFQPDAGLSSADPSRQFVPRSQDPLPGEEPPDGVRAMFVIEPTPPQGSKIDRVTGSLKVLQAQERKTVVLDKLATRVGAALANPEFEAAGLEGKLTVENNILTLRITRGDPHCLNDVKVIREKPNRDPLFPEDSTWTYDPAKKTGRIFLGQNKITDTDSLEVTFFTGLSEIVVPFAFEDLIVPPRHAEDDE